MKTFPFTWVRHVHLNQMRNELAARKEQITAAGQFIKEIEKGNLDASFNISANNLAGNELTGSLISMRDQIKKISEEEKQRHWVTEGLAKFVDILRTKNNNLTGLSDSVISHLVKYMGANQGALYLVNDDNPNDQFIEMIACYAYGRKKTLSQRIEFGEGLTGQTVLEKSTVYMTSIPANFIKITSGLGEALPRNLLLVPLKLEENIFGIVELASFEIIHPYQIQFVERLGESIASTISSVKISQKTGELLRETQVQTERLQAQEEEMRQSMEELTATQEEMQRILKETQGQERFMNDLIDSCNDSILVIDKAYQVVSANKTVKQTYATLGIDLVKGLDVSKLFDAGEWPKYKSYYDRTFAGETFQRTELFQSHGFELYFLSQHSPIRDSDGNIVASSVFAKDVTELMKAQKTAEKLAADQQEKNEELKAQEEELRQNMEELSATQEEMHRILKGVQEQERFMNELIDSSSDSILVVDKDLKVITGNKTLLQTYSSIGLEVTKGFDVLRLFNDAERPKYVAFYERTLAGETFHFTEQYQSHGFNSYFLIQYTPIRDQEGEVVAAAAFAKDITEMTKAQKEVESMANQAQQQNEELKAQEEELRQNMEELSATQDEMQRIILEVQGKEQYLDCIINASTDVIFTVDHEYKVISFNNAMAKGMESLGVKLTKGFPILSIFDEQKLPVQKAHYDRAFNGERFQLTEHFNQQGLDVYSLINYASLASEKGEIFAVVVFSRDVSEMHRMIKDVKQSTEAWTLKEQELQLRERAIALTTPIYEMDTAGIITHVNEKLSAISGYSEKYLIGKPHDILWHRDMPRELIAILWNKLKQEKTFRCMLKNKAKDGKTFWTEATMAPVESQEGEITKYFVTEYHFTDDAIASMLYEKQKKLLGLPVSNSTSKQLIKNGHDRAKAA